MHVRSSVAHQFVDRILPYLERCDLLAAEMGLDEYEPEAMIRGSTLPEGVTLDLILGEKSYQKIRKSLLRSFGVDLALFRTRHPFLVSASISESLLVNDQLESLDQEIWNRARSLKKTCVGLESFARQMEIMQEISVEEAVRQLRQIGRNPKSFRRNLRKMINFYVDQDVRNLYKSSRKQLEGLRKKMLFDRNRDMSGRLVNLMKENTVFAAVGAAHLDGAKGMLRFIKNEGFKVKPVKILL